MVLPKEFLKSIEVPYIGSIAISSEDYINYSSNLTQDLSENIIFLKMLSLLQQEFKSWNDNLSHLNHKSMIILSSDVHYLPITRVFNHDSNPSKISTIW